ncbi:MAG: hypothetical protein CBE08_003190 [Euryarchaeota archaeon TMED248]|nr:MAG: hypothetical protein CBE08_003190 [Euryarchaeota archaeon TMED248]|tara:strand:+ start:12940 stop:14130 length:1191 start_codon:yes stop_codon:yes gene_type:complete
MAKGWRRFLEEESEHQWLAISVFFIFIIIGAFAIHGTSKLTGMDINNNSEMPDSRIMHIEHASNNDYTAIAHTPEGMYLYQFTNGKDTIILDSNSESGTSNIDFLSLMNNGSVATSISENSIMLIDDGIVSYIDLSEERGSFGINKISQNYNENLDSMILITDEGDFTSFRGAGVDGIPSSATPETSNIEWRDISPISENEWIATGLLISSNGGENNPASPKITPVVGHVIWTGGFTAPMIQDIEFGDSGEFHSMVKIGEKMVIAGTSQTLVFDSNDLSFEYIDITSKAAIKSDCETIWFFGTIHSETVIKWNEHESRVIELQHKMPIEIETFGSSDEMIFMYGTDASGNNKILTFDSSSYGSIESGRGFLNFSFLLIFSITFVVMGWNVYDRMNS